MLAICLVSIWVATTWKIQQCRQRRCFYGHRCRLRDVWWREGDGLWYSRCKRCKRFNLWRTLRLRGNESTTTAITTPTTTPTPTATTARIGRLGKRAKSMKNSTYLRKRC
jgi:hypothetical protein